MSNSEKAQFVVQVLGSGTCVPSASRFPPSYFVKPAVPSGGWLLDIGAGALQRLAQASESYKSLESIFISHVHADHVSGILPLLQALNFTPGFRRTEPLIIYGPHTVKQYLELNLDFSPSLRPSFPFDFVVLADRSEVSGNNWHLVSRVMKHSSPTIGFRFALGSCTLVYGADTEPCNEIMELAEEADLLILESSFRKDRPSPGHLTTSQAGEIAKTANVKKLLLSHLYPEVDGLSNEERETEVRASGFTGEVMFAEDLMKLEVSRNE